MSLESTGHKIIFFLAAIWMAAGLASCLDEPMPGDEEVGQGTATVSFDITAMPQTDAELGKSRASGTAIETISNVFVAFYKTDGTLAYHFYFDNPETTKVKREGSTTEEYTECTRNLKAKVNFGKYRIYSVVNCGDLDATNHDDIQKESGLKQIPFKWVGEVSRNCQMSGYFNTELSKTLGSEANVVTVNKSVVTLYSWAKRLASKVTVAFDGKGLNENVYIYLKSVQIRDIPVSCPLVSGNTPSKSDEITAEGEKILFSEDADYEEWPCIAKGRGANTYGSHENSDQSLFFYENLQGTDPKKHQYQNFDKKDGKLFGTYVEVKGYYVNNSRSNPSYGDIIYRFMLGQNVTDDFNATRNTHYKLTLVFNNDANDPDWHIEFGYKPNPPQIVAHDVYISYLYNRSVDIPVKVYYDKNIVGDLSEVKAEIIRNPWEYDYDEEAGEARHPFSGDTYTSEHWANSNLTHGFLTLKKWDKRVTTVKTTDVVTSKSVTDLFSLDHDDKVDATLMSGMLPVYTRPLSIRGVRGASDNVDNGLSGNNFYVGRTRTAKVKITANFTKNNASIDTIINVIQVKRLVNPKGIWRSADSQKEFHVILYDTSSSPESAEVFEPMESKGPWRAEVTDGDWVEIRDSESTSWGKVVEGSTLSDIEFYYRPASTISSTAPPRFGMIEVTYHDNTCDHVILVSQGYGTVDMGTVSSDGKTVRWHMGNVRYAGGDGDVSNPLEGGSMFMFGSEVGLKSTNNLKSGYGFEANVSGKEFDTWLKGGGSGTSTFSNLSSSNQGFTSDFTGSSSTRVSDFNDWNQLFEGEDTYSRYYGVMYGDECSEPEKTNATSNTYTTPGDQKGMRGMFVRNINTGSQLFFPIGNTGYGRRKGNYNDASGTLRYANRSALMDFSVVKALNAPALYTMKNQLGALYWINDVEYRWDRKNPNIVGTGDDAKEIPRTFYAWDINYTSFGFGPYDTNIFYDQWFNKTSGPTGVNNGDKLTSKMPESGKTDAAFVRLVDVQP